MPIAKLSLMWLGLTNRLTAAVAPALETVATTLADMARSTGPIGIAINALFDNIGRLSTYAATFAAVMAGFALLTTFSSRTRIGVLAAGLFAGPVSRFDLGNALEVDLYSGTLESVTDITLLGGANALAVETGAGQWEIVQAGSAELIAPGRYRLTRLLRGQRRTEGAIVSMVPTGARVVVLDTAVASLPISEADLGLSWNWRIGPASTLFIAAPPNGTSVWVRVLDEVSGAVFEQEITADLPASAQFLSPRLYMNNGATAAAVAYDCAGVYVETDF